MASISVTINTPAGGPFNLAQLFAGNTYAGAVTVNPATPLAPPSQPQVVTVQADPANGANFAYLGDRNISPTSSATGIKLAAGVQHVVQQKCNEVLAKRYINASAATVVVNIEALGGAQ
jgi:hypothetical protein